MRSFLSRATALGVLAMAVSGCVASNGTALPPTSTANNGGGAQGNINGISTGTAAVRFVHGSPDAGPVDICVDGTFLATNVSYKTVSGFYILTGAVPHEVSVYAYVSGDVTNSACGSNAANTAPLTKANGTPVVTSITPASNTRTTAVIGGQVAKNTIQLVSAAATALNLSTPLTPSILFINASPANAKLAAGTFNATTGIGEAAATTPAVPATTPATTVTETFSLPAVAATSTAPAQPNSGSLTVPGYSGTAGVAVYVATTAAATTPLATLYAGAVPATAVPSAAQSSAADTSNTLDILPYTPKVDYLLTAIAIDGRAGTPPVVVGAYDPTTLGY